MGMTYVVKTGETLHSIAAKFGLSSFRDIYDDGDNADLRAKRPNPNAIYTGDVIIIPQKSSATTLDQPRWVKQTELMACWSAAMEAWLELNPKRQSVTQEQLREDFKMWLDPLIGGLTGPGWGAVARRFKMARSLFTNDPGTHFPETSSITLEFLEKILNKSGHIIIIYNVNAWASHVNVIYGAKYDDGTPMVDTMEPHDPGGKATGFISRPLSFYTSKRAVALLWALED